MVSDYNVEVLFSGEKYDIVKLKVLVNLEVDGGVVMGTEDKHMCLCFDKQGNLLWQDFLKEEPNGE